MNNGLANRPIIKAAQMRLQKGLFDIKLYQSGWYPSINLSIGYGSSYYYAFQKKDIQPNATFRSQIKDHSSEFISLSLSIPIFDRLTAHHNVCLAKINQLSLQNKLETDARELNKAIYQAYYSAQASKENLKAIEKSVLATFLAFQYEETKYNEGKSSEIQYRETKNRYQEALSRSVRAKYESVLRMQILEFYQR